MLEAEIGIFIDTNDEQKALDLLSPILDQLRKIDPEDEVAIELHPVPGT